MSQMTTEQKSLWRIENHYIPEAASEDEKMFWEDLKKDKEAHIERLAHLIKQVL